MLVGREVVEARTVSFHTLASPAAAAAVGEAAVEEEAVVQAVAAAEAEALVGSGEEEAGYTLEVHHTAVVLLDLVEAQASEQDKASVPVRYMERYTHT